jgi:F0F1-type ATP synthase delta subunit
MKTESNNSSNIDIIMSSLSSSTIDLPVAQLLSELQVVIERLSFSGLVYREDSHDAAFMSELDLLFEGEISSAMMDFLHWLASRHILVILTGRTGHLFLNHCNKIYSGVKEIKFITSIDLSAQYRNSVMSKLRTLYPLPARIVCESNPSLKAGFIIQDNSKTVDLSLKSRMDKNIKTYVRYHAANKKVAHV